jgi:hypothetical protein
MSLRDRAILAAKFSALSYTQEDCGLKANGFDVVFGKRAADWRPKYCGGVLGDLFFIIVEGISNADQWVKNLSPVEESVNRSGETVYVLQEFQAAVSLMYDDIMPRLDFYKDKKIYFAGHSRGGGIAQLLHAQASENFPQASLWSFSFGGPAVMSYASSKVTRNMWSFRHNQDIIPLLGVHILKHFFCDKGSGSCEAFLNAVALLEFGYPLPTCKALVNQSNAIYNVITKAVREHDAWHVNNHLGNLRHLLYWPPTEGMPSDPMPLEANPVLDFMDDRHRADDIWSANMTLQNLFKGRFIADHDMQSYLQFFEKAPDLVFDAKFNFPWASRLSSIKKNPITETAPEWIPDLSKFTRTPLLKNVAIYEEPWMQCVKTWDRNNETLECHLIERGCATRIHNQGSRRTYIGSQCWKLNHPEVPSWLPPYSDECYANATKHKRLCRRKNGQECTIIKNSGYLMAICSGIDLQGKCDLKIGIANATGESWYYKKGWCTTETNSRPDEPPWVQQLRELISVPGRLAQFVNNLQSKWTKVTGWLGRFWKWIIPGGDEPEMRAYL